MASNKLINGFAVEYIIDGEGMGLRPSSQNDVEVMLPLLCAFSARNSVTSLQDLAVH